MDFIKAKQFYEKHYKHLMLITILMLVFFASVLAYWKFSTGEFVSKDISLKGGLLITVNTEKQLDINAMKKIVEKELNTHANVKSLKSVRGNILGYSFEISFEDSDKAKTAVAKAVGFELVEGNYSVEQMSSALGTAFWQSTIKAIILAFLAMSIVVFLFFRVPVPSSAVILAAVSDTVGTLAIMNLIGIPLSTAGVAAILMLIGYSVDSNILLSARVLKGKEGGNFEKVYSAIGTGLTMQTTAIIALAVLWIMSPALVLRQIASVLIIGLMLDIMNTWIQNTGILLWYIEGKK